MRYYLYHKHNGFFFEQTTYGVKSIGYTDRAKDAQWFSNLPDVLRAKQQQNNEDYMNLSVLVELS